MAYILNKYECELFGRKSLFFPATNPKRLIISFAPAGDFYSLWSWFWRNNEDWQDTAYLFLKDANLTWYLGNNDKSLVNDYKEIIEHFIKVNGLSSNNVIAIGGSMGGYAAIFYAVICQLRGAIAFNPQINKVCATERGFPVIRTEDRWVDLDQLVASAEYVSHISLSYNDFHCDKCAGLKLIDQLQKRNSVTVFRKGLGKEHKELGYDKKFLETEIWYLENAGHIRAEYPTMNYVAKTIE